MTIRLMLPLGAAVLLAACGGGSASKTNTPVAAPAPVPTPAEIAAAENAQLLTLRDEGNRIADRLNAFDDAGQVGIVPTSGTASYTGTASLIIGAGDIFNEELDIADVQTVAFGELEANVNFGTGALNGSATDFVAIDVSDPSILEADVLPAFDTAGAVDGTLAISAAGPGRGLLGTLDVDVSGQLTLANGDVFNMQSELGFAEFYGNEQEVLELGAIDSITLNGNQPGYIILNGAGDQ